MMVVKLMIILTWIFATDSGLELGRRIIRLLFVAWPCLGVSSQLSEDRFYFCTDGLLLCWVRNAPPRPLAPALSDILPWMLSGRTAWSVLFIAG